MFLKQQDDYRFLHRGELDVHLVCLAFPIIIIGLRDCVLVEMPLRYQFIQQLVHARGLLIRGVQQNWMSYANSGQVPIVAWAISAVVVQSCGQQKLICLHPSRYHPSQLT